MFGVVLRGFPRLTRDRSQMLTAKSTRREKSRDASEDTWKKKRHGRAAPTSDRPRTCNKTVVLSCGRSMLCFCVFRW